MTAKRLLILVSIYKQRIKSEQLSIEDLYDQTFGFNLNINYDLDRIQNYDVHAGEKALCAKIDALDKHHDKVTKKISSYLDLIDYIESLCEKVLEPTEFLVVKKKYFEKHYIQTTDDVAKSLHYSKPWCYETLGKAYRKIEKVLVNVSLPDQIIIDLN